MAGFHDRPKLTQQGHASRCFFLKCSNSEDLIPGLLAVAMPLDESVKKELTDAVQDAQKSGIVQGMQKVLALLSKHGLLQSQVIEPSLVGVHPVQPGRIRHRAALCAPITRGYSLSWLRQSAM